MSTFFTVQHTFKAETSTEWWVKTSPLLLSEDSFAKLQSVHEAKGFWNHTFAPSTRDGPIFGIWEVKDGLSALDLQKFLDSEDGPGAGMMNNTVYPIDMTFAKGSFRLNPHFGRVALPALSVEQNVWIQTQIAAADASNAAVDLAMYTALTSPNKMPSAEEQAWLERQMSVSGAEMEGWFENQAAAAKAKDAASAAAKLLKKQSIDDVDMKGQRVLMRVDFNVPQDKKTGEITNNQRINGAIPTIQMAFDKGARAVILMSHLGRPDGKPNASMTLKPVAVRLGELMNRPVTFLDNCVGPEVEAACASPADGSIIVLENLRFHLEEEGKNKECVAGAEETQTFRKSLAKLGDVYVNDAFGTAHRAHSSMVGMKGIMPCVAGLLVNKELDAFSQVLDPSKVQRPLTAIVGGAKISDKILVIENLIDVADRVMLIGGMAYTFMKIGFGMDIGKSLFDKKGADLVPKLLEKAKAKGVEMVLPVDWACGQDFCNDQEIKTVTKAEGIPDGWEGMDCGPESMSLFREKILDSKTVIWNGPAGVFEFPNFSKGTKAVLDAVAETTAKGNKGIIGGGDSATAAAKFDMEDKVTFVSTGGGASLELLEGKVLPGIDALDSPAAADFDIVAFEKAELEKKKAAEAKKQAEKDAIEAENLKRMAEIESSGKRAAGGMHKFDPDEVDVNGGKASAEDFMDAFGF